jgi:HD-GYP domain-containing protein (c-di-GMP phosphodiesterase class II)
MSGVLRESDQRLAAAFAEIDELNRIGAALSAEREMPKLLAMILTKSRQITGADAGSLYLVEADDADRLAPAEPAATGSAGQPRLRFVLAQNDSVYVPFRETTMEISHASIAGHVALTGETVVLEDAYQLPEGVPYTINRSFDRNSGYRTKSILAVAMRDQKGKVVGVLQLINAKRGTGSLASPAEVAALVVPFSARHRDLIVSLASQAAVALENSRLVAAIERLFEGFVRAAVFAIEQRDPTTCGHSFRVANLTLALAEAVNRERDGPLAEVQFTPDQLKEIRYAALLHDFGKVAVREDVLVKATKLLPTQLETLRQRFAAAKQGLESEMLRARLAYVLQHGEAAYRFEEPRFERELQERLKELDGFWKFVQEANLPTVHPEGEFQHLDAIAGRFYKDLDGVRRPLLTADEVRLLSIRKGSLDEKERAEMEAHVVHTQSFLNQIPWTAEVRNVPVLARAHHEKLNGSGYPHRLQAPDIPLPARMMAIADIFDGLTATDRPYKKAVSPEQALTFLQAGVAAGEIDADLFRVFASARVWETPDAETQNRRENQ